MELTKDEAVRLHRELWDWLSKNPKEDKSKWPEWEWNGGKHEDPEDNKCFACNYCYMNCSNCLFIWPGKTCVCKTKTMDNKGLFMRWHVAMTVKTRKKLAAQIRDLPVRNELLEGVQAC